MPMRGSRLARVRICGRAWTLTAAAVVTAALGCAGHPRSATLPPAAQPQAVAVVPLGLCEDYPEESRSMEEVSRDIALLRLANVRVLRVSVGWDGVEPERGRFDFAFLDALVELMRAHGIHLIPYVAYTPRWAVRSPGPDYWRQPPAEVSAFAEVMATLAKRYAGRIGSWELWNEPDNKDYWLGSPTEYAALLAAGARAVHAAAPSAQVVM